VNLVLSYQVGGSIASAVLDRAPGRVPGHSSPGRCGRPLGPFPLFTRRLPHGSPVRDISLP
jgi:hypothetical protein